MTPSPCQIQDCKRPSAHSVSLKFWTADYGVPMIAFTMSEFSVCAEHRMGWAVEVRDGGSVILDEQEWAALA